MYFLFHQNWNTSIKDAASPKKYHSESRKRFKNARHAKNEPILMREIGKEKSILIEKQGFGRTEQYSKVIVNEVGNPGEIIKKKDYRYFKGSTNCIIKYR